MFISSSPFTSPFSVTTGGAEQQVSVQSYSDGTVAVELPAEGRQDIIFRVAADTGTKIRGLHPKRSSLEERFMAAIRRQEDR